MEYNKEFNYKVNGESKTAHYTDHVPFSTMLTMIDNVAFSVANEYTDYSPILEHFFTNVEIIKTFTDVELPENIDDCYDFIENNDIIITLSFEKAVSQIQRIEDSIHVAIEHQLKLRENSNPLNNLLVSATDFLVVLNNKIGETNVEQLQEIIGEFTKAIKEIPPEELAKMFNIPAKKPRTRKAKTQ